MLPLELEALTKIWEDRERRKDTRFALAPLMLAEANRDPKRRRRPYKLEDFMLHSQPLKAPPVVKSWQEQLGVVEQMNRALGGRDLRPQRGAG